MALQGQRREKDPYLSDFHHDMNEHGAAEYKKATADTIAELDSMPSGWAITLWRAVSHPTREGYAPPVDTPDNRYAWDARARGEYADRDEAAEEFAELKGKPAVEEFADQHPYEGPRAPYHERVSEQPRD